MRVQHHYCELCSRWNNRQWIRGFFWNGFLLRHPCSLRQAITAGASYKQNHQSEGCSGCNCQPGHLFHQISKACIVQRRLSCEKRNQRDPFCIHICCFYWQAKNKWNLHAEFHLGNLKCHTLPWDSNVGIEVETLEFFRSGGNRWYSSRWRWVPGTYCGSLVGRSCSSLSPLELIQCRAGWLFRILSEHRPSPAF